METIRTCVGCRRRDERRNLTRIKVKDGVFVCETGAVIPGRGAWIHTSLECLDRALERRAFPRALRVSAETGTNLLREQVEKIMDR